MREREWLAVLAVTVLAALYLFAIIPYPYLYILGDRPTSRGYHIPELARVADLALSRTDPKELIPAEWPGNAAFAQRSQVRGAKFTGFEWPFGRPDFDYDRFNLVSNSSLVRSLDERTSKLVLIRNAGIPAWRAGLEKNHDWLVQLGNTYVYERKAS